ncbi:MAG: hypothetical protein ABEJ03_01045 [Candidatus Nanohaloarchaea archaeon]
MEYEENRSEYGVRRLDYEEPIDFRDLGPTRGNTEGYLRSTIGEGKVGCLLKYLENGGLQEALDEVYGSRRSKVIKASQIAENSKIENKKSLGRAFKALAEIRGSKVNTWSDTTSAYRYVFPDNREMLESSLENLKNRLSEQEN